MLILFQSFQREPPSGGSSQQQLQANSECRASSPRKPPPNPSHVDDDKPVITLGEHIDSIITKDLAASSYRYEQQTPAEHWKLRRKEAAAAQDKDKSLAPNERQIIRIAQPTSPRPPYHVEPVSPPEQPAPAPEAAAQHWMPGISYIQRPFHPDRPPTNTGERGGPGKPHLSPLDYVKNRIVEVMRTSEEDHKTTDSHYKRPPDDDNDNDPKRFKASPATKDDNDDKRDDATEKETTADSPQSGDMVIDEEASKVEPVSPATTSSGQYYPTSASSKSEYYPPTTYAYPYSALSVRPIAATGNSGSTQQPSAVTPVSITTTAASPQPPRTSQNPSITPQEASSQQQNAAVSTATSSSTSSSQQGPSTQNSSSNRPIIEPAPLLSSQYEPLSDPE
jgi:hypothetical protein